MDKISWNEQFMGWPLGPEYIACSNSENASKLEGKLLLSVGELDTNVTIALLSPFLDLFDEGGHLGRRRVCVERNRRTHLAAQEVVNRHARSLAHDVPERAIYAAESIVPFDTAPKIRLKIGRLPDVFNLVHIAAHHEWLRVLLEESRNS